MMRTSHIDRHYLHTWLNKHTETHRYRHTDTVVPRVGTPKDNQETKSVAKSKESFIIIITIPAYWGLIILPKGKMSMILRAL